MYNKEQSITLQEASRVLLKENAEILLSKEDTETLRQVLRFHEHRYYVLNDPFLADGEYDQLYKLLERTEKAYPDWITKDSPTQRVGKELTGNFVTVPHLVPMLSLDNSYNESDLKDFDRRAKQLSKLESIAYCVEPKFDGGGISLIYENDFLVRGATRGNGIEGDDITTNIKQIGTVPLSANFSRFGLQQVEIRGEVLMNKNSFKQYNDNLIEKGLAPLANPRNAATGSLRIKDPSEVKRRNLEAFVYFISSFTLLPGQEVPKTLSTHHESLKLLWELGFRSPVQEMKICSGIEEVIAYCQEYEQLRDNLPYEIDGMVVKVNKVQVQEQLGMTSHHPRWAMAFKFKARQATSKLLNVEFQVGRTGSITPVAKIEPVYIGGVTVSSISLFNEDIIKEKDLMIGDTVLVERAGDVIPYIVKSLAELRSGSECPIEFPKHCPVCNNKLFKEEGEVVWRCINLECEAQVVERMIHFVSKDALDIRGLGEANIRKFYELGFLKDIPGIYKLDYAAISQLEGFGKKSIDKLMEAIEQSKSQPLNRLIFALGIRFVGETTAKVLAQKIEHLFELKNYTLDDLQLLEDIGPKVAGSIVHFFSTEDNVKMLEELQNLGVQMKNENKQASTLGGLNGLSFLFTGTLPTLKRSDAEAMAEAKGGKILSGVSAKLNYLIVGEDAGSKLEKAKKLGTINILSEAEFLELIKAS